MLRNLGHRRNLQPRVIKRAFHQVGSREIQKVKEINLDLIPKIRKVSQENLEVLRQRNPEVYQLRNLKEHQLRKVSRENLKVH